MAKRQGSAVSRVAGFGRGMSGVSCVVLLIVVVGVMAASPQTAAAQGPLPACPAAEEAVTTTVPSYARRGGSIAVTAERDFEGPVNSVTLALGDRAETFFFGASDELRIIRAVPGGSRTLVAGFSWEQGTGTPAACAGSDQYSIPVIAPGAKAGNPEVARLSGRWAVRYGRGGSDSPSRARWRLRPRCDVFGCRTVLRSNAGFRGTLKIDRLKRYRLRERVKWGTCTVTYVSGREENFGIYAHVALILRVTRARNGVARALRGLRVERYDIPSDALGACNTPGKIRQSVRAKRL
jgi:hypothetical protein